MNANCAGGLMILESLAMKSDNTICNVLDDLFVLARKIYLTEAMSLRKNNDYFIALIMFLSISITDGTTGLKHIIF